VIGSPLLLGDEGGYNLTRSLRFRSSASAYLSRTPATAGSLTTFTYSGWVKRGTLSSSGNFPLLWAGNGGSQDSNLFFYNDVLQFETYNSGTDYILRTTQVFRDPAAWYHIVAVWDTTNATSTERMRLYVNGQRITAFSAATYPALNYQSFINAAQVQNIGKYNPSYFDGYMAEVNFIDGQALTPSSFGEYSLYNQWLPKKYAGTYGTNGFYLPFTNNASTTTLGYDFSPQGNNWTTNNISVTAGSTYDSMTDVPTLTSATAANFAVLNPLDKATLASMSDGNLKLTNASAGDGGTRSTIACTDGMWYAELIVGSTTNANSAISFGLISTTVGIGAVSGYNTVNAFTLYASNLSQINNSGSITGAGSPFSAGDILQVAFDRTNNRAWVGKNNSWFDSSFGTTGNPSTAANPTFSSIPTTNPLAIFAYAYANSANANFGQRPFAYTPPSGYVALNTYNL